MQNQNPYRYRTKKATPRLMTAYNIVKADMNRKSAIEKNGAVVALSNTPDFGEVKVIENPMTSRQTYMKENTIRDFDSFEREVLYAKKRLEAQEDCPHLSKYHDFTTIEGGAIAPYIVRHFVDIPKVFLSQVMKTNHPLLSSSIFLTKLLYAMIGAGAALESKQLAHGNISPEFISFKEPGIFKLVDNLKSVGSLQGASECIKNKNVVYTSPELFRKVLGNQSLDHLSMIKHDVFCLGVLFLHLGTGMDPKRLFNYDGTFDWAHFNSMKNAFKERFCRKENTLLSHLVTEDMLQHEPNSRMSFINLQKILPPWSDVEKYFNEEMEVNDEVNVSECNFI